MQIEAILFAVDGTAVDANDMHALAWEKAFAGIAKKSDRQIDLDEMEQEKLWGAHRTALSSGYANSSLGC